MTARLLPLIAFICLTSISATAQIKSQGAVPADLRTSPQELYEASLRQMDSTLGNKSYDKQKITEATYYVSKLMSSGRVAYGDPISTLSGRIADTLLRDFPALRSQLRFYTVKSSEANAFTTANGMIFINTGLVAQMDNEAQLAFVISHEIVHYYRHHAWEKMLRKDKQVSDEDENQRELDEFLRTHNRSHAMENESDSLGLVLFYLRSSYSKNVCDGVFDVLQYSAQPFDDIIFDTTFFDTPHYHIGGCWLDTVATITSSDNYNDSLSTHPNILKRRTNCNRIIKGQTGGKLFIVATEAEFLDIRNAARIECIRQQIIGGDYPKAFYNTWLMLQKAPDNERLNQYLVHSLYSVAMFKNHSGTNSMTGDYTDIEGESQQVYHALRLMTPEQTTVAALNLAWKAHQLFPNNKSIVNMCDDLMDELRNSMKASEGYFKSTPPPTAKPDSLTTYDSKLTKYERIKRKKQALASTDASQYAFVNLLNTDTAFANALKRHLGNNEGKCREKIISDSLEQTPTVIVANPQYIVYNYDKKSLKEGKSMKREQYLQRRIMDFNEQLGYRSADFTANGLRSMTTDAQYNEYVALNEWLHEFWQTKGLFEKTFLTQPEMDAIADHYGSSTVSLTNIVNAENISHENSLRKLYVIPLIPIAIYEQTANRERTSLSSLCVDTRGGKSGSRTQYSSTLADHNGTIDGMLYGALAKTDLKDVVGYCGRRLSIAAGANLGSAGYQAIDIHKYLTLSPWASVEFALSPTISLIADCRYTHAYPELNENHNSYDYVWELNSTRDRTDMSKHFLTWSLGIHKYSNSSFAPFGPYFGAGLHYVHFLNPSDGSYGGSSGGIYVSGGRNYIFWKRFMLNIEARYGYTAALMSSVFNDDMEVRNPHKLDALFSNLIQLKIGVGVLLF